MENKVIFITGIDTSVGKTYATGVLARSMKALGRSVTTMKMVQTGCEGISEDIEMHRRLMGIPLTDEDRMGLTCPYLFKYPCSPHMAAAMEKNEIIPFTISMNIEQMQQHYNQILIEAAGGLMVPLNFDMLTIEYIRERHYPVVLVTSGKLGSINHTLLSLFACAQYGIKILAVIYNQYPKIDAKIEENTYQYLERYISHNYPGTQLLTLPEEDAEGKAVFTNLWF
ncbi:dethiobiotin synthase [Parabacteroides gordonii]|jgi:dethiobiotin synthetase|uniref:ATP-dependent dethiobiotin synthetase BioD n=1 Tax=Parabacteroides gordonii MS-1 = DSM 23371 TaxID=1203610 RepID=A0A0F5JDJ2_9BACT|nr:dethiobiotin synthase [Parabacteroides gordonii]KKB55798.1 dethiobiotin synthase [Parabacteroides gordonii MS-1 = DSM 23371]MCA5581420.1 dethiobiotin synthase [Parabacteroides gordonii]RGP18320.1 ATP-dependent dethiobiotin synthetase BioD [Parabacteroides gordonii]